MSQPEIIIYTGHRCAYCAAAKRLLDNKNVTYREINIHDEPDEMETMLQRTQRQTVPQIFIGETYVGGFDDLAALNSEGKLDELLNV